MAAAAAADRGRAGHVERDIEQAITALKKGAYLLKYGRRGKPKFCPFRLSNLKDMAERLPVGAAENSELSSSASFNTSLDSSSFSDATAEKLSSLLTSREKDANGSSEVLGSNGQSTIGSRNNLGTPVSRNGSKVIDADPNHETEWVEQDEPGVYITLTSLPEGARDLKRVRFSRKRFSEKQAEQWWAENRARVYEQYSVRTVNRSAPSVGNSKRSD